MDVAADCHRSIDVQNVGFTLEQSGGFFDDPQGMFFPDPALVDEVILEKIEIGLARIVWGEELSVGRDASGGLGGLRRKDKDWNE